MKKIIFGFLVVLSQVAYSQTSKNFGDFSAVKVYDRINVTLVKSSENKIQVKGDDPDVEIVNKNGELKIRMIPTKLIQGDKSEVTVFYEDINEIQASQGSKITSDGTIDTSKKRLETLDPAKPQDASCSFHRKQQDRHLQCQQE